MGIFSDLSATFSAFLPISGYTPGRVYIRRTLPVHMYMRLLPLLAIASALSVSAQEATLRMGNAYAKAVKGLQGDLQLVTNGTTDAEARPVLMVMEGGGYKAVRLGNDLKPSEELALSQTIDGAKWEAITAVRDEAGLQILFVSNGKKNADYGVGSVSTSGSLAITGFHKVASFPQENKFDAQTTTCKKTLPDLILFDNGAAYDQSDRLVRSPDGQHYLLNHYTAKEKGPKRFWYAYLDKSFNVLWQGEARLPYEDVQSDIHQIALGNDGTIHLLTYVFGCGDPERASDKLCHETHITILRDQGARMKDLLLDKDFVASVRLMPKNNGQLLIAMRYGSLTGQPGWAITLDTAITKLKPTPLVDQRVPAVRKTKLAPFGMPPQEKKPGSSRQVKVPDEVIEWLPAWNGGTLLLEGFRDPAMEIPVGDAVALRTLHGAVRATFFDAKDSLRWERTVERAFMTTAGEAYGSIGFKMEKDGLLLLYNQTPGGLAAMNGIYGEADVKKKSKDAPTIEPSVLRAAWIAPDGRPEVMKELARPEDGFTFCPMTAVFATQGDHFWLKAFDRGTQHRFGEGALEGLKK